MPIWTPRLDCSIVRSKYCTTQELGGSFLLPLLSQRIDYKALSTSHISTTITQLSITEGSSTVTHHTDFAMEDDFNSLAMGDNFDEEEQEEKEEDEGGEAPDAAATGVAATAEVNSSVDAPNEDEFFH